MAAKAARLVRLSRLFGSREGPAKLNTPGKAELGPAGNAVFFQFGTKRRGKMLRKGVGVPRVCPGLVLGMGLAPFPGDSGVGVGACQCHSPRITQGEGQEPPMLLPPIPGSLSPGSQMLAPRWASKGKEQGPSGSGGCLLHILCCQGRPLVLTDVLLLCRTEEVRFFYPL